MRASARARAASGLVAVGLAAGLLTAGCDRPMAKIERLTRALETHGPEAVRHATEAFPPCPAAQNPLDDAPCLGDVARALGSASGFEATRPNQATDAAVAVLLARDEDGSRVARADVWLAEIREGKGAGVDALRLATARQMAKASPKVGRALEDDAAAREVLAAVAASVPGACPTYARLGAGAAEASLPVELSPDHAACVQKDLARREGPGPRYGTGVFRALEGALAVWREAERALRQGAELARPEAHVALEEALRTIEPATLAVRTKRVPSAPEAAALEIMAEIHAEAGVGLGPDAGPSRMPPPLRPKAP